MSLSVQALCRLETAPGFALAGLAPQEAATAGEGARKLLEMLDLPGLGVLLVEEPFYDALPEESRRQLGRRTLPMVVPFPAPAWAERAAGPEAYILEILRQAIGYRVRLR